MSSMPYNSIDNSLFAFLTIRLLPPSGNSKKQLTETSSIDTINMIVFFFSCIAQVSELFAI